MKVDREKRNDKKSEGRKEMRDGGREPIKEGWEERKKMKLGGKDKIKELIGGRDGRKRGKKTTRKHEAQQKVKAERDKLYNPIS